MTNYIMLTIGCLLIGLSQTESIIPQSWVGAFLCVGVITIVWAIIWDR